MRRKDLPEYRAWKAMKARCYAPSSIKGNYLKNNITVCAEWLNDFDRFLLDMGQRPSDRHSLDRVDNLKGYSKENCRWATQLEQVKNRENCKLFTHNGKTMVLKDWAKEFGIKYTTLYQRIFRDNLAFEDAILADPFKRLVEIDGKSLTVKEWCLLLNIHYGTVISRVHRGMDRKEAILKSL